MVHRCEIRVRFYELDPYNHLNHSVYIQYFEVGRIELLEKIGFGLDVLADRGVRLVITEIQTRFLKSVGPGDFISIETQISEMRRAISVWNQQMIRGDEIVAHQEVTFAATDPDGKPVRFPEDLVIALTSPIKSEF
tara:strand:- start:120 stop:527 length:408 start_codon:yes stop_codon:yes gene_type:complete